MSIFHHSDYKSALKAALQHLKSEGKDINLSMLAMACRIQKTYLSKVLNHDGHLNSDQLYLACKFLRLKPVEQRYLSLLHEADRSSISERRETLLSEAKKFQAKSLRTEEYLEVKTLQPQSLTESRYYLDPVGQLIHMLLTIPRYAKDLRLIESTLQLTASELESRLKDLTKLGIIYKDDRQWRVARENIHLPQSSDLYPFYRVMLRIKALEKLQKSTDPKNYSFSGFISADEESRAKIHEKFLEFLKSIAPIMKRAKSTEVYQVSFDLLKWT